MKIIYYQNLFYLKNKINLFINLKFDALFFIKFHFLY